MAFRYVPRYDNKIDETRCVAGVYTAGMNMHTHQCSRKRVIGEWCKQHSPQAAAEREAKAEAKYQAERDAREQRCHDTNLGGKIRRDYGGLEGVEAMAKAIKVADSIDCSDCRLELAQQPRGYCHGSHRDYFQARKAVGPRWQERAAKGPKGGDGNA